ncbi:MAG: DUF4160 domain-containing protein [Acidobacteria bacterium]|nr:DUF4160 domain-containing protein [Acidobacteriota bacterium]
MPTVLRIGPYRFFFYAGDREEPPHVHVECGSDTAKFWLEPVRLAQSIVEENQILLRRNWDEYFEG